MQGSDSRASGQMQRWELERYVHDRFESDEVAAHGRTDIVTISRQRGSGGTLVGKLVAKQLGWDFYDRELLNPLAEHLGAEPEHLETHDERAPGFVSGLLLQLLEGQRPTGSQYLQALVRVLRDLRTSGKAVIMGRGSNLVVTDALRVRVVAPSDIRIERIAELDDMTMADARQEVLASDRQRDQFIRSHFGVDPDDATYYDLLLNTAGMSLEHAASLVTLALENRAEHSEVPPQ